MQSERCRGSTATADGEINLATTPGELVEIEKRILTATRKHNEFLKELGLPLLPLSDSNSSKKIE
jgi:type I restriction enzyme M protein